MREGFPPISVSVNQRVQYYSAINKVVGLHFYLKIQLMYFQAYEGNHSAFIECMMQGMKETIASMQSL